MYDLKVLKAIVQARKHLRSNRELTSFECERSIGISSDEDTYRIRGYLKENQLYFDLHPMINGRQKEAVAKDVPLIAQIACLSDQFRNDHVRCRNLSGNHDWIIEFTKSLHVVLSEYELLPGSQADDTEGMVYLVNDEGEILSVESRFLTIFEPVKDVNHRMTMETAVTLFQQHLMDTPSGQVSKDMLNAAFMLERALNAGHIDMVDLDLSLVLETASTQLNAIGTHSILADLATAQDELSSRRKAAQVALGLN